MSQKLARRTSRKPKKSPNSVSKHPNKSLKFSPSPSILDENIISSPALSEAPVSKFLPRKLRSRHVIASDLWSILTTPVSILTLLALCILPAFYAWFNIIASWDPYTNTRNIQVAVANEDVGTGSFGETVNIGNQTIEKLRTNDNMGWQFVDASGAVEGVRQGKYYASVVIPSDFSKNMMSFLSEHPTKPKIIYTVNEKINAIVPKITQKGVESIESQIESAFIGSLNEQLFDKTNTAGKKIEQYREDITKARSLINEVAPKMGEIHSALQKGEQLSLSGIAGVNTTIFYLPDLSKSLDHIIQITDSTKSLDATVGPVLDRIPQVVSGQMALVNLLMNDGISLLDTTHDLTQAASGALLPTIRTARTKLERADQIVVSLGRLFVALDRISGVGVFTPMVDASNTLHGRLSVYITLLKKAENTILRGEALTGDMLSKLQSLSNSVNGAYMNLQNTISRSIRPALDTARSNLLSLLETVGKDARLLQGDIPKIKRFLEEVRSALADGSEKISRVLSHWGEIDSGVQKLGNFMNTLSDDRIEALLELLLLDPENEKNFFTHPIELESHHLFPIPNYGSAIAPFFTILALWVGALLAVSLLSVRSSLALEHDAPRRGYFGRLLLFLVIGVIQALIVSIGNIFLLHTYVANPMVLVGVCVLSSLLFQVIVYSMVYLLGNVGKALAILLLLVQLSAASGTFPVELTNNVFIRIHPYLPFTYAINAAREAVGGVVPEVLAYNITILGAMLVGVFVIAILLAPYLSRFAIAFEKRTEHLDIFH